MVMADLWQKLLQNDNRGIAGETETQEERLEVDKGI